MFRLLDDDPMKRDRNSPRPEREEFLVWKSTLYRQINESFIAYKSLSENPFVDSSFIMLERLFQIYEDLNRGFSFFSNEEEKKAVAEAETSDAVLRRYIRERYYVDWQELLNRPDASSTHAEIYEIFANEALEKKVSLRLNDDHSLIVKAIPLLQKSIQRDDDLWEIYNEIRVGFFLNELLYAYPSVLSYNFRQVVDWFILFQPAETNPRHHLPHQYIISEQVDLPLEQFLDENGHWQSLACVLFQVLHALETAWATNRFIHYDLHMGNVRLKKNRAHTRFHEKHFLYRRVYDAGNAYLLERGWLGQHMVKLIDFGRSRMMVAQAEDYAHSSPFDLIDHIRPGDGHHQHSRLLSVRQFEFMGNPYENRSIDVRALLWSLLVSMSPDYWRRVFPEEAHVERQHFIALCDRAIDFIELNRLLLQQSQPWRDSVQQLLGYPLDSRRLIEREAELIRYEHRHYSETVSFLGLMHVWTAYDNATSASVCLDEPFFDHLRLSAFAEQYDERLLRESFIVMSAPEPLEDRTTTYSERMKSVY